MGETRSREIALLGLPWDRHSSFLRGAAQAPPVIRERLFDGAANLCTEAGADLSALLPAADLGDLDLPESVDEMAAIVDAVGEQVSQGKRLLCLGGDHAVTYPILRATAPAYPDLTIVQFDAHPDLYDSYQGDRYSHACGFARIMEGGLATRLVQLGIRAANDHQRQQARRFSVELQELRGGPVSLPELYGPIYLSLDLDVLDPSCAPGVSHQEPGGLSTRELLELLWRIPGPIIGADIVEFNPVRDGAGITAAVAAKLVKEVLGLMLTSSGG